MTTDQLIERLRAADPAGRAAGFAVPSVARVYAARRRRRRVPAAGGILLAAATVALALPALRGEDVVARAAAALRTPGVLHMHSVTRTADGRVSGSLESWRAVNGDRRALLRRPDGRLVGEITIRDGVAASWNARGDELYLSRDTALDDDSLEQLSHAKAGDRSVSRRPDTTVRGIPVHVIVIAPTVAGEDRVPARTYYIDKDTNLPVRIAFGKTITDVLQAEQLRGAGSAAELQMSPHPSAEVHDLR
jgi:hypothetical protein